VWKKGPTVDSWIHEWYCGVAICRVLNYKKTKGDKSHKPIVKYLAIIDGVKYKQKAIGAVRKWINKKLGPVKGRGG
jgi:hypothetical protein